ncbi:hypothetical protein [Herbidospora cretacea]|uniref:hypothetical protein n=1 Tax=Herbidospora cretacea TaxID=28444 RepID=UPI0007738EA8|nr:hypothetical protein [Herbidospora cretacea]
MRSTISVLTVAALLLAAAPAQAAAAPKDPVKALKALMLPGKGVTFTDVTHLPIEGRPTVTLMRRTGKLGFGRGKIAASDITATYTKDGVSRLRDLARDGRTIRIGGVTYSSGGEYTGALPKGKRWFKQAKGGMTGGTNGWFGQVVNAAEPSTLAALIKEGKRSGGTYSGTLTMGYLGRVSPWFDATMPIRFDSSKVTYKLTIGANGLPLRLRTTFPPAGSWEDTPVTVETRYQGWGRKVSVKAPDSKLVTTKEL